MNKLYIFWEISKQTAGSDHVIIQFTIHINNGNLVENPLYSNQYNFNKADWKEFENDLIKYANMDQFQISLDNSIIFINVLEKEAEKLRDIILKAARNIPKKRV